ncbi:MAG: hypothetical protein WCN98_01810 [Verrucomicrobiaceae bacterium]
MSNKPTEISMLEWKEIMSLSYVEEGWGIDDTTTPEEFAAQVYGVKFQYCSGSPGYVGDLFILQGDTLESPVVIIRKSGVLQLAA